MNRSPIVDEIRNAREAHARSHGFDLNRIAEDIRHGEQKLRDEGWTVVVEKVEQKAPAGVETTQ